MEQEEMRKYVMEDFPREMEAAGVLKRRKKCVDSSGNAAFSPVGECVVVQGVEVWVPRVTHRIAVGVHAYVVGLLPSIDSPIERIEIVPGRTTIVIYKPESHRMSTVLIDPAGMPEV